MIHLTVQQLSSALDGALGGPSLELVVRHLARCHECRDRQARLARFDDALRRLLAQDPHDFFMDDLGRRAESIVVAVARGLPVPPMVTSIPLIDDEDPLVATEPAPAARPELGRAAEIARDAGFGLIGLKPAGSRQAPAADPGQAQRMLEALAGGDTADFEELTSRDFDAADESEPPAVPDGPTFDLPAWVKEGAPRGRAAAPGARVVRAIPKLQMMFDRLDERTANISRGAVEEVFRKEPDDATTVSSEAPAPNDPIPSEDPESGAGPSLGGPVWAGEGLAVAPGIPGAHEEPVTDAYEHIAEPPDPASADDAGPGVAPPSRHVRRGARRAAGAGAPGRRGRSLAPVAVALTSVGALAALVAFLQFSPPDPSGRGATAARTPRLPRIEFVGLDSTGAPLPTAVGPDVRVATTPAPVESLVSQSIPPHGPAPADSGAVTPPADSLGRRPGR